jgi:hypothetical protein
MIAKSKAENDPIGERRAVTAGYLLSVLLTLPCVILNETGTFTWGCFS